MKPYRIFRHTAVYVGLYLLFLVPTYLLPWLGSNSSVGNAIALAATRGMSPLFWLHLGCLLALCGFAWIRGVFIARSWLVVTASIATAFDLIPGLSFIPLVPTVLHLVTMIAGSMGQAISEETENAKALKLRSIVTLVAVSLSLLASVVSAIALSKQPNPATSLPKPIPSNGDSGILRDWLGTWKQTDELGVSYVFEERKAVLVKRGSSPDTEGQTRMLPMKYLKGKTTCEDPYNEPTNFGVVPKRFSVDDLRRHYAGAMGAANDPDHIDTPKAEAEAIFNTISGRQNTASPLWVCFGEANLMLIPFGDMAVEVINSKYANKLRLLRKQP